MTTSCGDWIDGHMEHRHPCQCGKVIMIVAVRVNDCSGQIQLLRETFRETHRQLPLSCNPLLHLIFSWQLLHFIYSWWRIANKSKRWKK